MIPRTRDALSQLLARTFPSSHDIDAETVDAFVDALMRAKQRTTAKDLRPSGAPPPLADEQRAIIYMLRATHARRTPITSVFTGQTECVRATLGHDAALTVVTPIGLVLPKDHLLPTVKAVRERFGERIGRPFARVDLVAPPRYSGARFSPMSLYLGYECADSPVPCFVVFEAGDATGNPMALYLAETLDTVIEQRAGYSPTPFSSPDNWYTGGLRMAPNGRDPEVLYMRASKERGGEPHLRLHVEYTVLEKVPFVLPAEDLVEAALRVLAIQKGMGLKQNLVERLIAEAGALTLPWVDRPDNAKVDVEPVSIRTVAKDARPDPTDSFTPAIAFDAFVASLPGRERGTFEASVAMLLAEIVRADGKFDRLERIEVDWIINFEVPSVLGDAFRFSDAAQDEYRALVEGTPCADLRPFDARLVELGGVVSRLPEPLRAQYKEFVTRVCRSAAESSGGWLWFGTKVSGEEKAVLDRVSAVLDLGDAR